MLAASKGKNIYLFIAAWYKIFTGILINFVKQWMSVVYWWLKMSKK